MAISKIYPFTGLTSGTTTSTTNVRKAVNGSYNITVASIGTNVVVRAEYSLDGGTTWSNCNASDTTITANGQYAIPIFTNNINVPLVGLNWVSTSTGSPTITGILRILQ